MYMYMDFYLYIYIYIYIYKILRLATLRLSILVHTASPLRSAADEQKKTSAMEAFSLAAKGNCKQMRRIAGSISISTSSCL